MEQIALIASQRRNLGELKLKSGIEEKMHTDQGSQYRCKLFHDAEIKISMDGRGRYLDNIFIERLEMVQMMRKRQGRFPYNSAHHLLSSLTLW